MALRFRKTSRDYLFLARRAILILAVSASGMLCAHHPAYATLNNGENAIDILGQFASVSSDTTPDYVKSCNNNGASQIGFNHPQAGAIDAVNHRLFIMDYSSQRILVFTLTSGNLISSKTPANVIGQSNFSSCAPLTISQSSFYEWEYTGGGMAFDAVNNRLFVADGGNNRVLVFNTSTITNGMNASYVLGQSSYTTNTAATTQAGIRDPTDVAFDSTNELLYVADSDNARVLVFNVAIGTIANAENASYVLGQSNFTTNTSATTQAGLASGTPYVGTYLALDPTNQNLYVGDGANNRVMVFPAYANASWGGNGENASYVLGQSSFTTNTGAETQAGMSSPTGLAYDSVNSRLFVADGSTPNNRVLVFNTASIGNGESASYVLGELNFTTGNYGSTTQNKFSGVGFPIFDSTNELLYVADLGNNRVMVFNVAPGTIANGENASDLLGQYTSLTSTASVVWTQGGVYNGPTPLGFSFVGNVYYGIGMALDILNHNFYVADGANNRVMVYTLDSDNSFSTASGGHTASYVLGQSSLQAQYSLGTTKSTMSTPSGLAFDPVNNLLYVADLANSRVLVFSTASISNGMNASYVLGQSAFTTGTAATTQTGLSHPNGLALDVANQILYVSDNYNNRIMVFNVAPGTIANGENASYVLGQANFTSGSANGGSTTSQSVLNSPFKLALDSTNQRLFVADTSNNRVMVFNVAPGTIANGKNASYVLGQSSFTGNGSGTGTAQMSGPDSVSYDSVNSRLFVAQSAYSNTRLTVFNVAPSLIANGMSYSLYVDGAGLTQNAMYSPEELLYDPGSGRLFVGDTTYARIMIFDGTTISTNSQNGFLPGYE